MLETDTIPLLEISDRQDLYSMSYVRAIIAAAGFNLGNLALDRNSSDVDIVHSRSSGFVPCYGRLCVQVKCTYAHTINKSDGAIHFPLPIKNYNDLRQPQIEPHILVAVLVPRPDLRETEPWIECVNGHTVFRYRAYWLSLLGAPEPKNGQKKVTVKIPACNTFDVSTVHLLMTHMVAQGNKRWSG